MKLNKQDFIELMAEKCECSKVDAKYWIEAIFDGLAVCLADKNSVYIPGFGTFVYKEKAACTARNPRTGETVNVPAHGSVGFKPAGALKESVR